MINIKINRKKIQSLDLWLIAAVCGLAVFGIICIGSALRVNQGEDPSGYYSQMMFFVMGLVIMFAIAFIDLDYFSKFDKVIYLANLALLLAVIFFGKSSNNAVRWIKIGPVTIQPSEFAKVIMIFCIM